MIFYFNCFFVCIIIYVFIDYCMIIVPFFSPHYAPLPCTPPHPSSIPYLSLCLWVIHVGSLATPFLIVFLTSPCLFCTYHLCFLFPVHFPTFSPFYLPNDHPPCDLCFCDSVLVVVVCLVHFCFLDLVIDNYEFVVILQFIFFINFFFLGKSL